MQLHPAAIRSAQCQGRVEPGNVRIGRNGCAGRTLPGGGLQLQSRFQCIGQLVARGNGLDSHRPDRTEPFETVSQIGAMFVSQVIEVLVPG